MNGFRILADDEIVQAGDVVKDIESGEYCRIEEDTLDGLLIGMSVKSACECNGVNAILRKI